MNIEFRECPKCGGYGVRDNGDNCTTCGGSGRGGLNGGGQIGSGELMFDRDTGRRVTAADLVAMSRDRDPVAVRTELIQTAAMCVRTIVNVCDRDVPG